MLKLHHLMNVEDPERIERRNFPNGDVFVGTFKEVLPHGMGKYSWSDGTVYEGDWEEGKMTGKGIICWPSGASYDGDFSGGYLHGFGTFIAPDGSKYRGAWRMNIQHGIGRKQYSNSDIYEGSWKEGVREGSGSYVWNTGNAYIGSWKGGKMNGRGVVKWANGDVYDGFWLNGLRHGSGVYRFVDGAYYFGSWNRNLKDGKGTFYPAGTKHPSLRRWQNTLGSDDSGRSFLFHSSSLSSNDGGVPRPNFARTLSENGSINRILGHSGRQRSDETWELFDSARELLCRETSSTNNVSDEDPKEVQDSSTVIYEREYMQGVLIKEKTGNVKTSRKTKQTNRFDLEQPKRVSCVDIFDGHQGYHLMLCLQLGIRYTVGKITPVPMREVRASDFGEQARIRMYFPRKGSQFTPPHYSIDFYWKDYCPMVFRNLREMFKLDAAEFMMSICGDDGLKEISSPGKSGSIFYLSHDGRFVIKTLKKHELKALLRMLRDYYRYVGNYENTLITKFFGAHRITLRGGRKVRFVVMGNMFFTELRIHRRYDLKGSTHGRSTNKDKIRDSATLKDLDLTYEFHMDKMLRDSLFKQLSLDCSFLESQQIIDYSLLLGIHFRAPEHLKAILEPPAAMPNHDSSPATDGVTSQAELLIPPKGLLLVTHEPNSVSTAPGPHIRGNTLRAYSVGEKEVDLLLPGTGRLRVQLGVNMPAQANHKVSQHEVDAAEVELFEVYDVVLYMGIIDILQEYNIKKKVERALKSLKFDPITISVAEPSLYAKRLLEFLGRVFPEQP